MFLCLFSNSIISTVTSILINIFSINIGISVIVILTTLLTTHYYCCHSDAAPRTLRGLGGSGLEFEC